MHWYLRLLENDQIIGEEDFLKDQFFVYEGMFGVPAFCIWWMAPDKTFQIYQGMAFKLLFYRGAYDIYYAEDFIVKSAIYDSTKNLYKIYAIGTAYNDLFTSDFITATVLTNKKDQPISGKIILENMIKQAFPYLDIWFDPNLIDRVGYFAVSFDRDFSCLDLLTKICNENNWEWYLRTDAIFIRNNLHFKERYITFTEVENDSSKSIDFLNYKYLEMEAGYAHPGALYGLDYRVLWVIYNMGGEVGGTMGVMLERNKEHPISEDAYLDTLMNIPEKLIYERKTKTYEQNSVIVGKIFGTHSTDNLGNYEAPVFSGDVKKYAKWLKKREFKTSYAPDEQPLLWNKDVALSTPYAGNGVGIQYPQDESHRILIAPDGDREEPIVGPAYFGFGDIVPKKSAAKDFRLQLPGGWCLYVKENGDTILQVNSVEAEDVIDELTAANLGMSFVESNDDSKREIQIGVDTSNVIVFTNGADGLLQMVAQGGISLQAENGQIVLLAPSDAISISGDTVDTQSFGDTKIQAPKVVINAGEINLNGVKISPGGIIEATLLKTPSATVPPKIH